MLWLLTRTSTLPTLRNSCGLCAHVANRQNPSTSSTAPGVRPLIRESHRNENRPETWSTPGQLLTPLGLSTGGISSRPSICLAERPWSGPARTGDTCWGPHSASVAFVTNGDRAEEKTVQGRHFETGDIARRAGGCRLRIWASRG